jgi:hypothetical protein
LFSLHGFFFLCFLFWFFPALVVCAGSFGKAERPPETRHELRSFFWIASGAWLVVRA